MMTAAERARRNKNVYTINSITRVKNCIRDANVPSWKTAEKAGFVLEDTRMYKDINDSEEQLYRFYAIKR